MRMFFAGVALMLVVASVAEAQSLQGSLRSVDRMYAMAKQEDFTFLRSRHHVMRFVRAGYLVHLPGNVDYAVSSDVSYPYARPATRLFLERLSAQYRAACDDQLVVTSATRPMSARPRNGSRRSVHPTGMALDLRVSRKRACRRWLERTLLSLEARGVVEATRERWPPHYHVAVFPTAYEAYVAGSLGQGRRYRVQRGDTLWDIARAPNDRRCAEERQRTRF